MSPERYESYNETSTELGVMERFDRYRDVELGDVDHSQGRAQVGNTHSTHTKKVDLLQIVRGMISTGFTPTQAQLKTANLNGPHDSTNTWFAFLLQKLIRQFKLKKSQGN